MDRARVAVEANHGVDTLSGWLWWSGVATVGI